jgi:hypothetical protein
VSFPEFLEGPNAHSQSPYEVVLADLVSELHPHLQAYFRGIPSGMEGVGSGVFHTVGTPRRWLWPVLAILQRQGVLFPVWQRNVPFTVVNRPGGEAESSVSATRTFQFSGRQRRMTDEITADGAELVDYLGIRRRYRAQLTASVRSGMLVMRSSGMAVRVGAAWLRVPRWIAPVVTLTERIDDASGRQHVEVVTTVPGLGRVYEYAGSFDYELRRHDGVVTGGVK